MNSKHKKISLLAIFLVAVLFCVIVTIASYWSWRLARLHTSAQNKTLFQGIQYQRKVTQNPRPMVAHVVTIDLRQPGLSFLVTPGDPDSEEPLKARTTSVFLEEFGLQLAVNGDGFTPWHSNSLLDYYPKAGDPVTPLGLAASKGTVYAQDLHDHPALYLSRNNTARFNSPPGQIYNAISGSPILVLQGKLAVGGKDKLEGTSDDSPAETSQPRTAIGLDKNNRKLIIIVVDGRQPGYSEGVTLYELAQFLIDAGAYTGMNLDGGGSSTLVMQGNNGGAVVLNSPIDNHIPGRERNVGNHLGIYAPKLPDP